MFCMYSVFFYERKSICLFDLPKSILQKSKISQNLCLAIPFHKKCQKYTVKKIIMHIP